MEPQFSTAVAAARTTAQLDTLARSLWAAFGAGMIEETEADALSRAMEARRQAFRSPAGIPSGKASLPVCAPRKPSLFMRARLQSPPDRRRSLERRRRLASSGPMPPTLAAMFTTGELAALRIVADEVRAKGICACTLAEIAARAGVGRTTAQNAIRLAAKLGLATVQERRRPGRKNLSNLVTITSPEWRTWIARGPSPARAGDRVQNLEHHGHRGFTLGTKPQPTEPRYRRKSIENRTGGDAGAQRQVR